MTESVFAAFRRLSVRAVLPLLLLAAACATPKPVHLASNSWPPYTGNQPGAQVSSEIVAEALARSGYETRTTIAEWKTVMPAIRNARYDGSAAVWRNAEREEVMLYSRAYLENRLVLVGRKGADVSATSLADLAGKHVAIVEGYAYGEELARDGGPTLVHGANDQTNLERLMRGDVDLMLVDDLLIRYVAARQKKDAQKHLEIGTVALVRRPLHFAVRRDLPGAPEIVAAFNRTIGKMIADGAYNRILRMSWIRADVDGDGRMEYVAAGAAAGKAAPKGAFAVGSDAPASAGKSGRYYINGQVYDEWNQVPEHYRQDAADSPADEAIQVTFFNFDF